MSDDLFDFEDVVMDFPSGSEDVTTPLCSDQETRGALHESLPPFVASEATGGSGK
jgi:hypothetical protein